MVELYSLCVMVVLAAVCCGTSHGGKAVRCASANPCSVYPTDTALLTTQHINEKGVWRIIPHHGNTRNPNSDPLSACSQPWQFPYACVINNARMLTNQDSGIYYYNYPTSTFPGQPIVMKYDPVNVIVLAPPSITSVPSLVVVSSDEHSYFNVSWYAVHTVNVTVTWTHNDTLLDCKNGSLCEVVHRDTNSISLRLTLYASTEEAAIRSQAGVYKANVSNLYGYKESIIQAEFHCAMANRIYYFSENTSIAANPGQSLDFTCKLSIGSDASLYVCFVKPTETLGELEPDIDCARCTSGGSYCYNITNHPQIMVQQVYDTCMQYASVTFRIASLKSHDSGRFYCGWIDGTQTNVTYYTNVTLAVSSRHLVSAAEKISLYIAVPLASVVVVVVAVVIAVAVYRKRQRNAPPVDDQHRGGSIVVPAPGHYGTFENINDASGSVCPSVPDRPMACPAAYDSDQQHLIQPS